MCLKGVEKVSLMMKVLNITKVLWVKKKCYSNLSSNMFRCIRLYSCSRCCEGCRRFDSCPCCNFEILTNGSRRCLHVRLEPLLVGSLSVYHWYHKGRSKNPSLSSYQLDSLPEGEVAEVAEDSVVDAFFARKVRSQEIQVTGTGLLFATRLSTS